MFTVISVMIVGLCVGLLLRHRRLVFVPRVITVLIWLLLFLLGVEVGGNSDVINSLGSLGVEAFVLAVAGVCGGAVLSWLLYVFVLRSVRRGGRRC